MVQDPLSIGPVIRVVGLTLLSLVTSMTVSIAYRWYVRDRIPGGVALLAGVSAVAIYPRAVDGEEERVVTLIEGLEHERGEDSE